MKNEINWLKTLPTAENIHDIVLVTLRDHENDIHFTNVAIINGSCNFEDLSGKNFDLIVVAWAELPSPFTYE